MSDHKHYEWTRYWCLRDGKISLDSNGFLLDPEWKYAKYMESQSVRFDAIEHIPCLALLGEPGIGKSTAMIDHKSEIEKAIEDSPDELLWLNLNTYGSEDRLISHLFESPKWLAWRGGGHVLHVFLDSLDECQLKIEHVSRLLVDGLQSVSGCIKRLRFRIACRTADFPATLENALPRLWPEDKFAAYELAPLTKKEFQLAVEAEGADVATFLAELKRVEAIPLAIKPITLKFLLTVYKADNRLPRTRHKLYDKGCLHLCTEHNTDRQVMHRSGGAGDLPPEQRLAIASRVAAVAMFCRKPVICTSPSQVNVSDDEISLASLAGGEVKTRTGSVAVSEDAVREVLGTGLFSGRGPHCLGFAHQTYAEFLAIRHLMHQNVDSNQIFVALTSQDGDCRKVIPQLYETAGWAASCNKDIFAAIVQNDPQVVLRGDCGSLSDSERELIVYSLLTGLNDRTINDYGWGLYHHYGKLAHPRLADQLRPWISDKDKYWDARYVAIDIAESCQVVELQDILADIALDQAEPERLRTNTATAIGKIGDKDTRLRLMPLALGQAGDDSWDQLKGYALRSLWPDLIAAETVFENLNLPKRSNFGGGYSHFLQYELADKLKPVDLPLALKWAEQNSEAKRGSYVFRRLIDKIVVAAWREMDSPGVLQGLADLCIALHKHYEDIIDDKDLIEEHKLLFDDEDGRRRLGERIVESAADLKNICWRLCGEKPALIRKDDFCWSLEKMRGASSIDMRARWALMARHCFDWSSRSHVGLLLKTAAQSSVIGKEFSYFLEPIQLDSEEAKEYRTNHQDAVQRKTRRVPKLLDPLPRERILKGLEAFENGNLNAWPNILLNLTLEDGSTEYDRAFEPFVTKLSGWKNAEPDMKDRILSAAGKYLVACKPFEPTWLDSNSATFEDSVPYKTILLLHTERPVELARQPHDILRHWHIALFRPFGNGTNRDVGQDLMNLAYKRIPEDILATCKKLILRQAPEEEYVSALEQMELCWDKCVSKMVFEILPMIEEHPPAWGTTLAKLLEHQYQPARRMAEQKTSPSIPAEGLGREIALRSALAMAQNCDDAAWSVIWHAMQENLGFGREVMIEVAYRSHFHGTEVIGKLRDDALADLFVWLVAQFPYGDDPDHDGDHDVSKDDEVRRFRDNIYRALENRGTLAACKAVEKIVKALPQLDWLSNVLVNAKKKVLQETWVPLSPESLLELTQRPDSKLVTDVDGLQSLILESLKCLEQKLQGETPAAPDIWNRFKPKDENHLSDYVKRHLDDDLKKSGVVAAREVEIRRGEGSGSGERTDIHVTAMVPSVTEGELEQVRVIIEAKGCWHRELKTAMETQLVGRYLKGNDCRNGIYLIGHYNCDQWDKEDYRCKDAPKWSIHKARDYFDQQAEELSMGGLQVRAAVLNTALR